MPLLRSLNTKLLLIVLGFVALGGILVALRQEALERERLELQYDDRLQRLIQRYQMRMVQELNRRQYLLEAARSAVIVRLRERAERAPPDGYTLPKDSDGAYRRYDGHSGVFVHAHTVLTPQLIRRAYDSGIIWSSLSPLMATSFDAFYLITPERLTRIWPEQIVQDHDPEHDVTQDIFYTFADPAHNPGRETRWTPMYFDVYSQTWMISLLLPLYEGAGGEFQGVVGADLDMIFLFDRLAELSIESEGAQSFIFSGQGHLILDGRESRFIPAGQLTTQAGHLDAGLADFMKQSIAGHYHDGALYSHSLYGEPHRIGIYRLDNMDWHVALHYPLSLVEKDLQQMMGVIYRNTLWMALLLIIVLYIGLRFFVTSRIAQLAKATADINLEKRRDYVPEDGQDEISQLGRSVNGMLDRIDDLVRGLNENIDNMEYLAYYDQLTGLQNRVQFKQQLYAALLGCERDGHHLALLYLDLDHFKRINDTLGHEAGDQLLVEVANRLRQCLREEDAVARLGGDEFAVLIQRVDSVQYAFMVASKIISVLNSPMQLLGQEVVAGVSIGITMAPDDSSVVETLMKNADLAMYQAKDKGRNSLQFYTPDMNIAVEQRLTLERELRAALRHREFELYYQPQVDLRTGEVMGVEALMRWHHPVRGLISPNEFIPVAEDSGLIVPMGQWALTTACLRARVMHKVLGRPVKMSVNVAARQLRNETFLDNVRLALRESGLEPRFLVLEVTESTLLAEGDKAIERLQKLRDMGVGLAIDDFGTGYSSLSHLKRLPVTLLKIDRSFVQDLPYDEEDRAITSLVAAMATSLNYEVVVEGVEHANQLEFLEECGCQYAQGFYFGRPLPEDKLLKCLFEWGSEPVS